MKPGKTRCPWCKTLVLAKRLDKHSNKCPNRPGITKLLPKSLDADKPGPEDAECPNPPGITIKPAKTRCPWCKTLVLAKRLDKHAHQCPDRPGITKPLPKSRDAKKPGPENPEIDHVLWDLVSAGIRQCIRHHGPINTSLVQSATMRVIGFIVNCERFRQLCPDDLYNVLIVGTQEYYYEQKIWRLVKFFQGNRTKYKDRLKTVRASLEDVIIDQTTQIEELRTSLEKVINDQKTQIEELRSQIQGQNEHFNEVAPDRLGVKVPHPHTNGMEQSNWTEGIAAPTQPPQKEAKGLAEEIKQIRQQERAKVIADEMNRERRSVRVYALARKLNMPGEDLLKVCHKAALNTKNQLSELLPEETDIILEFIGRQG